MRPHYLAVLAISMLGLAACSHETIPGTPTTISYADPNAPPGKTRAQAMEIKTSSTLEGQSCGEDLGGLNVQYVDRQTALLTNNNANCVWRALFAAYGVPPGATDTAQQHWVAGVYLEIPPNQSRPFTIAYSGCRDQWTVRFQTDVWALKHAPLPTDQPLPKQYGQDGIGLHEFGGHDWPAEECAGTPTPPILSCPADVTFNFPPDSWVARFPFGYENPWYPDHIGPLGMPQSLPVGTWTATVLTHDDHALKQDGPQHHEEGRLKLYAGGTQQAFTGPTNDIPDGVDDERSILGPFTTTLVVNSIEFDHEGLVTGFYPSKPTNSFRPVSVMFHCVSPTGVALR
jgi:hypothetical protein